MEEINSELKFPERSKTLSKNFYNDEILGCWYEHGKLIIHLKEGIRRLQHHAMEEQFEESQYQWKERVHNVVKKVEGIRDEENDYN
jgi:hypothetical protein